MNTSIADEGTGCYVCSACNKPKDPYDKLAQIEFEDMEDFINMKFGRKALTDFRKAVVKAADNEYETGRVDGLIEAIRILRD